uniref:Secreted protein n=1 Tax=Anopheles minimus TaxID=112268 RepID=A0A182VT87_9DIPT
MQTGGASVVVATDGRSLLPLILLALLLLTLSPSASMNVVSAIPRRQLDRRQTSSQRKPSVTSASRCTDCCCSRERTLLQRQLDSNVRHSITDTASFDKRSSMRCDSVR